MLLRMLEPEVMCQRHPCCALPSPESLFKAVEGWSSSHGAAETNPTRNHEVPSLVLLSELRIRCCCELWCRLQTRLRSGVAVAVV